MIISLSNFAGVAPMMAPHMLQPNQAQVASNTRLWNGGIDALHTPSAVTTVNIPGAKRTIYKFDKTSYNDANYWFTFTEDVSVCKGQIAGDTTERTYYTQNGVAKVTDSTLALSGAQNNYPVNSYALGVPAPSVAPTLAADGVASGVLETRAYVYTNVTSWGEESAPSPAATVDVYPQQAAVLTSLQGPPSGAYNVTSKRLYRTSTGASGTNYYFVAEIPAANDTYRDTVLSENLGEALSSLSWLPPPAGLEGLTALPNGLMAGFVGYDVYLCEPFRPYAWPTEYSQSVDSPIVGIAAMQQNALILTKGSPYLMNVVDPASSTLQRLDINQACVSRRSIAPFGNGVLYASPDGLVYVGTDGSNVVTQNWFTRSDWQSLNPTLMHGAQYDGRYYGFYYVDAGNKGGFIFDPNTHNGTFTFHDFYADACYVDLVQDALFLSVDATIYKWDADTSKCTYTWRSKVFPTPKPSNFSAAQVIASDYTDVTLRFYVDGALKFTISPTSQEPFRLPSGFLGVRFEVEVVGTSSVLAVHMAETMTEIGGV